jgi:predicted phosphoribosyltransferase
MMFANRHEAGQVLARRLDAFRSRTDVVVLALPRGGVPVAAAVAHVLEAPLDIFVVRKLGVPGQSELAMGAIASGGIRVLNDDVVHAYRIPTSTIDRIAARERAELERRELTYRRQRTPVTLTDRIVVLVDDGLATGSTMRAAVEAVRRRQPSRVVAAAPVGARETCAALAAIADDVVCASMPEPFTAVGLWYRDFSQTTDDEVRALLEPTG